MVDCVGIAVGPWTAPRPGTGGQAALSFVALRGERAPPGGGVRHDHGCGVRRLGVPRSAARAPPRRGRIDCPRPAPPSPPAALHPKPAPPRPPHLPTRTLPRPTP